MPMVTSQLLRTCLFRLRVRRTSMNITTNSPFVLDCMDAGGRATQGAVAESLSKDLIKAFWEKIAGCRMD
jgi:hypothetical protein